MNRRENLDTHSMFRDMEKTALPPSVSVEHLYLSLNFKGAGKISLPSFIITYEELKTKQLNEVQKPFCHLCRKDTSV